MSSRKDNAAGDADPSPSSIPWARTGTPRRPRTHTVGLAIPLDAPGRTLSHGPFSEYIECITDSLSEYDYRVLCLLSRGSEAPELLRLSQSGHVDGFILMQIRLVDPRLTSLQAAGFPFVSIGRSGVDSGIPWVAADLNASARMAVQHLLEVGHRRIALLGDELTFGYQYHALTGFRNAHTAALLPWQPFVLHIDPLAGVRGALQPFMDRDQGPTALITTTDIEAVMALHIFRDLWLRVPRDVGIVTLGDSVLTQLSQPAITAVGYSVKDSCRKSVDLLMTLVEGQQPRQPHHTIPVSLLPRGSTIASLP
jgi:DNA-binding LacI/PurR family transcriptional regulator